MANNFFTSKSADNTYIKISVDVPSDLPNPSSYSVNDLAFVYNGENEFISSLLTPWTAPKYKNPAGLYIVKNTGSGNFWSFYQTQTINSMNTIILDVTTDWVTFVTEGQPTFKVNSMLNYDGVVYKNLTGVYTSTTPDLDRVNWVSMIVVAEPRNPVQLKAISLLDQPITTDAQGTVPIPEEIQESNGISLSNGEITFVKAGFYRAQLQLNLDNSNNTNIETWAEFWDGDSWEFLDASGNVANTSTSDQGNFFVESTFIVPDNFMIRLKARVVGGSANFNYAVLSNGVEVPSMTFLCYELDPRVFGINIDTTNLTEPLYIGSGVNRTKIETDGTVVSEGDAITWDEISKSLIGRNLDTASGRIDYNYTELTIDYADNARYPDEPVGVVTQMHHARKLETEIRPHLHWIQNQNVMPNLLIAYRAYNNGELVPATFVLKALTIGDNVFPYISGSLQQITEFNLPVSVGEGLTLSGTFDCKIYRDTNNTSGLFDGTDAYTGTLSVKYFDIHILKDMNGSREEFVK